MHSQANSDRHADSNRRLRARPSWPALLCCALAIAAHLFQTVHFAAHVHMVVDGHVVHHHAADDGAIEGDPAERGTVPRAMPTDEHDDCHVPPPDRAEQEPTAAPAVGVAVRPEHAPQGSRPTTATRDVLAYAPKHSPPHASTRATSPRTHES